jgi:hypothetical protein
MSFAVNTQHRRFERVLTIFSAFAVLTSLMVMFAPTAHARHPEITASQICADRQVRIAYESVSWKTDGTPGSGHSNIRIGVQVNGAGPWIEVASGIYESGNDFRLEGTFDATPYWGESIVVQARAIGPWDNGIGGGETTKTGSIAVSEDCFTPSCPSGYLEYKVEPVQAGLHGGYFTLTNVESGGTGPTFDWSSIVPVYQVIVKGGPGANTYDYEGATSDSGLHAPENPNNGKWHGLTHVTFCYEEPEPESDPVDVTPNPQVCEVKHDVSSGAVSFNIDPASGATVQVYGDAGHSNAVGEPLGDDEKVALNPGTYYWKATATGDDIELNEPTSGQFTIDPCEAAVAVEGGQCEVVDGPQGSVTVSIDVESGAVVTVYEDDLEVAAQFSGVGGSQRLMPGTYTWEATPGEGFEFPTGEVTSGGFTIDPCVATVIVSHGNCQVGRATAFGSVTTVIEPGSSVTVSILDDSSRLVTSFSGAGGTRTLPAGDYTWTAEAAKGFTIEIASEGFTVAPCPDEVLGEVIVEDDIIEDDVVEDEVEALVVLPFTGLDTSVLVMASVILLGSGLYLLRTATRREEG